MTIRMSRLIKTIQQNFFRGPLDAIVTLLLLAVITTTLLNIFQWLIYHADWSVILKNFDLYLYGRYPPSEEWRALLWIGFIFLTSFLTLYSTRNTFLSKSLPLEVDHKIHNGED